MNITADKFISEKEESKLFETIEKSAQSGDKAAIVDLMLFKLLSLTGLRISEAINLQWDDISDDYIVVKNRKTGKNKSGKKSETVFIGPKLSELVAQFILINPYPESPYLFNTQKGAMKRTAPHERLKLWLKAAKLRPTISCHSFRHTYATKCLDNELPLTVVRDQLRHSSIAVTSAYLHFTDKNKEKLRKHF